MYVLFALSEAGQLPCMIIMEMTAPGTAQLKLEDFDITAAKCFDPNQTARLKDAIAQSPGGSNHFQRQIRQLDQWHLCSNL